MAAPPPPPPPPPTTGNVLKPNKNDLLNSIHKGIGLRKVPETEKNDRSCLAATGKKAGNSALLSLPLSVKSHSGSHLNINDALKQQQVTNRGNVQLSFSPMSRRDAPPPPNQNVKLTNNAPKPPLQGSKPSQFTTNKQIFSPPVQPSYLSGPRVPPPVVYGGLNKSYMSHSIPKDGINRSTLPPIRTCLSNKPPVPLSMKPNVPSKPMVQRSANDKMLTLHPIHDSKSTIPLPIESKPPPPVPYSMKPVVTCPLPSPMISYRLNEPNSSSIYVPMTNVSIIKSPPTFAPPPPPVTMKPLPKVSLNKPYLQPYVVDDDAYVDVSGYVPSMASRVAMSFDSRFSFPNESLFPIMDFTLNGN